MSLEGKSVEEIQALAELADALQRNPKTRLGFLGLTKAANPEVAIPEIDIPANLRQAMAEPLAQLDALTKKQQERDLMDQIEARRREIRKEGVTEAEVEQVEKLMVDKGIANHKTAVEHLRMSTRASEPTPFQPPGGLRKYDRPVLDLKSFNGDMRGWAFAQAHAAIDEFRGRKSIV